MRRSFRGPRSSALAGPGPAVLAALLVGLVHAPVLHAAEADALRRAETLARGGDHAGAEQVYDGILRESPDDVDARLGRAYVRSWRARHADARRDFRHVLARLPDHLGARIGLAFDLAWDHRYDEAERAFRQALAVAPDSYDARRGLAHVHLWSGQPELALEDLEELAAERPRDAELVILAGQAHLALGRQRRAREAFRRALDIAPRTREAHAGLAAAGDLPPALEVQAWGGSTSDGGDTGLRTAEVAGWLLPGLRLWARYDNSLSLDNPVLARTGEEIETVLGGALARWGGRWLTKLEVGRRDLAGDSDQILYQPEVVYLGDGWSLKAGGFVGDIDGGPTDRNLYLGGGLALTPAWRVEPTIFLSEVGTGKDREWRALAMGEYRAASGWTLGLGVGGGTIDSAVAAADGTLFTAHAKLSVPVAGYQRVSLLVRHESPPIGSFTVTSLGVTLRLPRN